MNVILFGATGMVGQGVLRECLLDSTVDRVLAVGRSQTNQQHPNGRTMWARVKGRTENALLALPFRAAYMFRPGAIVPLHGVRSRTRLYRVIYSIMTPLFPLLRRLFPTAITTTEQVGRAMLVVASRGYTKSVLDPSDINAVAGLD